MPCYLNKFEISFKYISIAYYNKLPEEIKKALTKQYFAKKNRKKHIVYRAKMEYVTTGPHYLYF